jgi:hypothetical protein
VTSPTQRHEEKKKEIHHQESDTKYPEVVLSQTVSMNKLDQDFEAQIKKKP